LCGEAIHALRFAEYVGHGGRQPIAVWLGLDEVKGFALRSSADGWSLEIDSVLEPADLGPYGTVDVTRLRKRGASSRSPSQR
jgi:hypothetical protein